MEKLKPTIAKAAENGITIAIENHVNSLIEEADSLRWLIEFVRLTGQLMSPAGV